jgi:hypothetical protein
MALMSHLWTGDVAPLEYIRLVMCRDVYHCTPTELDAVPWQTIQQDLLMMSVERTVQQRRSKK